MRLSKDRKHIQNNHMRVKAYTRVMLLLILFSLMHHTHALETITIGTSLSLTSNNTFMLQFSVSAKKAFGLFDQFLQQEQNGTITVGATGNSSGMTYQWQWRIEDDEGNYTKMMQNIQRLCEDPEVQAIVPTTFSNFAIPSVDYCDKIVVSPGYLPQSFYDNHTNLFQVIPRAENWMDVILPNLRYANLKRVGIIYGSLDFYADVCNGITEKKAKHVELSIVSRTVYTLSESDNLGNVTELEQALDALVESQAQVLFYCGLPPGGEYILEYLYRKKYNLGAIVFTPWRDDYIHMPSHLTDYLMIPVVSHEDMRSEPDAYFESHSDFYHTYANFSEDKTPAHMTSIFNFYAPVVIKNALERAKSIQWEDFRDSLMRTSLPTLMGTIQYDGSQRAEMLTSMLQRLNGTWSVVWPPYVSSAPLVMPVPLWTERIYNDQYTAVEWTFMAIASVLILATLCVLMLIFKWRHEQIINASMPLFLILIGLGSVLIYTSIFFWLNHQLSAISCIVRVWMLNVGFALMFGTLFSKNYAVLKIWTANLTKKTHITKKSIMLIVLCIASVHLVLLLVYTFAGDVRAVRVAKVMQPHRPLYDVEYCSNNTIGSLMLIFMTCWGLLLIVFKMVVSWKTRKIVFLAYNESKVLLFTTYNVAFFSVILLFLLVNEDKMDATVLFILRSTCLILGVLFTELILYGNKLWLFHQKKTNKSKKNSSLQSSYPQGSTHTTSSAEEGKKQGGDNDMVCITRAQYKEFKKLQKKQKVMQVENDHIAACN